MLKIYGTLLCRDCVECLAAYDRAGLSYEFCEFETDLAHLKDFLKLRDGNPLFDAVREAGGIGIPCILRADGTVTLDWQNLL